MHSVVLAGILGPSAPWTRGSPRPLLGLPRGTLIENLLEKLAAASEGVTICVHDRANPLVAALNGRASSSIFDFLEDSVPLGTAGCLRKCAERTTAQTFLLVGASVYLDDDPSRLVERHERSGNALTVFCEQGPGWSGPGNERHVVPSGVFCCDRGVLEHIRAAGFQDLKEQVIPALKRAGLRVGVIPVEGHTCQVSDWTTYTKVVGVEIARTAQLDGYQRLAPDIWCGNDVLIAPDARIVGPALIGHRTQIGSNAVLVGPLMLGDDCTVESDVWLIRVVAPTQIRFRRGCSLTDKVIPPAEGLETLPVVKPAEKSTEVVSARLGWLPALFNDALVRSVAGASALIGAFVWAFAGTIRELFRFLQSDADYSAGMIVPVAAAFMIATRRRRLDRLRLRFSVAGAGVFLFGLFAHVVGNLLHYSSLENFGMVACAIGVVWSIAGTAIVRKLAFPLLFLFLMCPLPHRVQDWTTVPLQSACANLSATALETVGIPVERRSHVLEVAGKKIAVAEACSGLRLALAFLLVTSVVVYVVSRPRWQKVIVLLSSIPIALACNIIRVVLSAALYYFGLDRLAQGAFHDGAGFMMMPLALLMILLEFRLLANLVVPQMAVPAIVENVEQPQAVQ